MPKGESSLEDWKQVDAQNQIRFREQMDQARKQGSAERDFYGAAISARNSVEADNLLPRRDEFGDLHYTVRQGLMAACLAREDVATTAQVQLAILKRLDRNRNLLYIVILLLLVALSKLG